MSDTSSAAAKTASTGGMTLFGATPRSIMANLATRGDLALALGVMAIIVVLILPLPAFLLDFSLAISITFSV
ncbi:MAG: hypothetical protein CVT72_05710, partial [Alphaproteobacteria bacterium HGW-Alphaproteobacteria-11]